MLHHSSTVRAKLSQKLRHWPRVFTQTLSSGNPHCGISDPQSSFFGCSLVWTVRVSSVVCWVPLPWSPVTPTSVSTPCIIACP